MRLRRIFLIFKNDAKRRLKYPLSIIVLMIIPLIITGIIGAVFNPGDGQYTLPGIRVLIADNDKNIGSKMFMNAFSASELEEMFDITMTDEMEGRRLISRGKASALIIIPEKFSENIINMEQSTFIIIKNPSEQFLPSIVEEFMITYGILMSGLAQVFEPEIREIDSLFSRDIADIHIEDMIPFLEMGKTKIENLMNYLDPLLISLETETIGKEESKPGINVFSFILPGMSILFLFFIIEIFLRDILSEREDGKLQRMMFAPLHSAELILARIFSGWIMGTIALLLIIAFGSLIFNIFWGNIFYLIVFTGITCFWIASFFALLNSFFKNKNQAGALTAPIILVFAAFGGSFFPVEQLHKAIGFISRLTLNYWFIQGTFHIKDNIFPLIPAIIIISTAIILFISASYFLKKRIIA